MGQFRIRLCQFHNDHHEIQQDICIWNHQVYPKYNLVNREFFENGHYILRFWIECKNHEKSWKSRCNTKMESKVVLNKPLWYNSVTPPPRIQTTYYVVKAQSTNPDKNLIKEIYEKNRISWKFRNFGWYPGVWIADYVPNIGRHFDRERRHCPDHTRLCLNRSINSISKNFIPSNF